MSCVTDLAKRDMGSANSYQNASIFVHAMWRSGSTYVWSKYRQVRTYRCYYEPLHESLMTIKRGCQDDSEAVRTRRHPRLAQPYFFEYPIEAFGGVRGFRKSFSYEDYCAKDHSDWSQIRAYLANLIGEAYKRNQRPLFQFNRSLMRITELTKIFSPVNLLLLRKPRAIWNSFCSFSSQLSRAE